MHRGTREAFLVHNVDVVLIDEVSMLESDVLKESNMLCQNFTGNESLFGGKSVIETLRNFLQLKDIWWP